MPTVTLEVEILPAFSSYVCTRIGVRCDATEAEVAKAASEILGWPVAAEFVDAAGDLRIYHVRPESV